MRILSLTNNRIQRWIRKWSLSCERCSFPLLTFSLYFISSQFMLAIAVVSKMRELSQSYTTRHSVPFFSLLQSRLLTSSQNTNSASGFTQHYCTVCQSIPTMNRCIIRFLGGKDWNRAREWRWLSLWISGKVMSFQFLLLDTGKPRFKKLCIKIEKEKVSKA